MIPRARATITGCLLAVATVAGGVTTDAAAADPALVREIVDRLGADDFGEREAALRALVASGVSIADLTASGIVPAALSTEQRTRLEAALFERFAASPRAGLGVQFDSAFAGGIRLAMVMPTFPASAVLRPGDIVERADGLPLAPTAGTTQPWMPMRHRILSHDPGETMPVVLRREGRRLTVDVPLGRYDDLGNAQPISDADFAAAWSYRLTRLGLDLRDAGRLAPNADTDNWAPITQIDQPNLAPMTGVIAGGRGGNRAPKRRAEVLAGPRDRPTRIVIRPGQAPVRLIAPGVNIQGASKAELQRQIQIVSAWLRNARAAAGNPGLSPRDRADAATQVAQAEQRLTQLRQQLALVGGR